MSYKVFPPPNQQEALAAKPWRLPRVEPLLRSSPPRNFQAYTRDGSVYAIPEIVRLGRAVKGWVVRVDRQELHEGPSFTLWVAYRAAKVVHLSMHRAAYDDYHWSMGAPEHHHWFTHTMVPGMPLTLLIAPQNNTVVEIFGLYELFISSGGKLRFAAE